MMTIKNKDQIYIEFLEALNHADTSENLYETTFQIIQEVFNTDRIQLWENSLNSNDILVSYEYLKNNLNSMLRERVPSPTFKINYLVQSDIKNKTLNNFGIKSLCSILLFEDFKDKRILVLCYNKKNIELIKEDLDFLIRISKELNTGINKLRKYEESIGVASTLQNQNNKLREKEHTQTNLINNIAHELRTPLSSILGFTRMLTSKKINEDKHKEIQEQINRAANRLAAIVTDFIEITRLQTEGWITNHERTDIGKIIKNAVEEFAPLNKKHNFLANISNNCPLIETDPKLVRQVLDNLITNSIKYSPNGGRIVILLNAPNKKELEISVKDEGLGIEEEEIPKIFNRFYRLKTTNTENIEGTGLGLAICKEIVSILNGKIKVVSKPNKGSTFTFTLPVG